jgi:hypothetical protein
MPGKADEKKKKVTYIKRDGDRFLNNPGFNVSRAGEDWVNYRETRRLAWGDSWVE